MISSIVPISVSIASEVEQEVTDVAEERDMLPPRAFGYYFLEDIEELSPEVAEEALIDGPWDLGRDAVYFDEDESELAIYQFKYSEDLNYLKNAFADIQRSLDAEAGNIAKCKSLRLVVATIATADQETQEILAKTTTRVKGWLTRHRFSPELSVELFDLKRFAEFRDKIYGLDLNLSFQTRPMMAGGHVLGLLDAAKLKDYVNQEALFAFNIRKFLTARKGSVNFQINQTLDTDDLRGEFYTLNNGIVCLCTSYEPGKDADVAFKNFTIVNGAQTISTIARFLDKNPAIQEPIWVVAKILLVNEDDVDRARLLTKTSNSQSPTNDKDLRAVDPQHRKLGKWFDSELGTFYIFRRGVRAPRGSPRVFMKDVAQAYIAYWLEKPNISFSRPGTIFSDSNLYNQVFPPGSIDALERQGDKRSIRVFLLRLVVPSELLVQIRMYLRERAADATQRKWRSLSYHLLWIYRKLIDERIHADLETIHAKSAEMLAATLPTLYEASVDFLNTLKTDIPRDLKSEVAVSLILERGFLDTHPIREVTRVLREKLS